MPELNVTVDSVQRPGGWYWFALHQDGRVLLWNDTPFPTQNAAGDDAYRTHEHWRRTGNGFAYAGAI